MKKILTVKKGDVIIDNGCGVYILTQGNKRVSRKLLKEWLYNIFFVK